MQKAIAEMVTESLLDFKLHRFNMFDLATYGSW